MKKKINIVNLSTLKTVCLNIIDKDFPDIQLDWYFQSDRGIFICLYSLFIRVPGGHVDWQFKSTLSFTYLQTFCFIENVGFHINAGS